MAYWSASHVTETSGSSWLARLSTLVTLLAGLSCQSTQGHRTSSIQVAPLIVSFEERLLARIPDEYVVGEGFTEFLFSPDGRSAAYVVRKGAEDDPDVKCFVVVGDRKGPEVSWVGAVKGTCATCGQGTLVFSPDGKRLAYAVRIGPLQGGREGVVVDGEIGPLFDEVSDPMFSSDSRRIAYEAREKGRKFAVFDNEPAGREYDEADRPVFSPDSKRMAYCVRRKGQDGPPATLDKAWIVVDGRPSEEYEWVGRPVFSPDSQEVAFAARRGRGCFIVNEKTGYKQYKWVGEPVFSPNGLQIAYPADDGEDSYIVVNQNRMRRKFIPTYYSVDSPQFALNGMRLCFQAILSQSWRSSTDYKVCLVVDEMPGEDCDSIHDPVFSPDGLRFGYTMKQGDKWFVVVDGKKYGDAYDYVDGPAFSPDGSRFAFVAEKQGEAFVVCGDRRSKSFDIVRSPVFSPDGRKLAFGARKGSELWWKVMNVE